MNVKNMKDRTDWKKLQNMTDSEIEAAASNDPDAPLLSEAELKQFKRVESVHDIDVRKIRLQLHLSQDKFAVFFGVSKRTIQEWEQKRRHPNTASRNFLKVVGFAPEVVQRALLQK